MDRRIFSHGGALLIICVLVVVAVGYFVWPTLFTYENSVYARVSPDKWGMYSLAVFSFPDDRQRPSDTNLSNLFEESDSTEIQKEEISVYIRTRKSRLTGARQCETWVNAKEGRSASTWFTFDVYSGDNDGIYATRGVSLREDNIAVTGNVVTRRVKLVWPDSIREEIEAGTYGVLKASIKDQEWWGVPAGEPLTVTASGESKSFDEDLLGLNVVATIENTHSSKEISVPDAFFITDDGRVLYSRLVSGGVDSLSIPPQTSKNITLTSVLVPNEDMDRSDPLYISNVHNGWHWEAEEIPSMNTIRSEYYDEHESP